MTRYSVMNKDLAQGKPDRFAWSQEQSPPGIRVLGRQGIYNGACQNFHETWNDTMKEMARW